VGAPGSKILAAAARRRDEGLILDQLGSDENGRSW